jgi:hypothetical protein
LVTPRYAITSAVSPVDIVNVAYERRTGLGLAKGAKLPKSIGTMPATGGGRNRRGRVTGGMGRRPNKQARPARV